MKETDEGDERTDSGGLEGVDDDAPSAEQLATIRGALEPMRVEPVMTYELDRPGRAVARECGSRLAERLSTKEWRDANLEQRRQVAREFDRVIALRLGTQTPPVEFDHQMDDLGGFDPATRRITLRADLLESDDPTQLVMTLAHEQRHGWQQQVIDGHLDHPDGPSAAERLRAGEATYARDQRNFRRYIRNELERDGEKFAYLTFREFVLKQRRA